LGILTLKIEKMILIIDVKKNDLKKIENKQLSCRLFTLRIKIKL